MKLGPITIGGRRDGSGYQHSTATIVITPEDGDSTEDCMARATQVLSDAFDAAEAGVEKRSVRAPAPTPPRPAPPAAAPKPAPSQPLQSFPSTGVGQLAKEIVDKAAPQPDKAPAQRAARTQPTATPSPATAQPAADADAMKRRVDAWRKMIAEKELSEGDFLKACSVSKPEELAQLQTHGLTARQLKAFVEDVAGILANADNVPV